MLDTAISAVTTNNGGESSCGGHHMLVLTRRAGESIMLDDDIELKVLKIKGSQVHIGIQAPANTTVHRKEVWERIRREQAEPRRSPRLGSEVSRPAVS